MSLSQNWVLQQFRELIHPDQIPFKYVVMDNDGILQGIEERVQTFGLKVIRTQPRSPWQNPYAERWVRTAREGCTDRIIFMSENLLRHHIGMFVEYYNRFRTHSAIANNS